MNQRPVALLLALFLVGLPAAAPAVENSEEAERFFESRVRPLLVEHCYKCHSEETQKGGLRLDSRAAALQGARVAAIVIGKPDESLLVEAVRHQNGLAMPPDGKLHEIQIATLTQWIKAGAAWPGAEAAQASVTAPAINPLAPNDGELSQSLQLWLRADSFSVDDGEAVYVWPDRSGHGRDFSATKGVRVGGVGLPARFIRQSTLLKRPGVRFETGTGFASSPDNPIEIHGDAALTIMLVMNPQPQEPPPALEAVLAIGNPAYASDPGRPLAAMVQFNRGEDYSLRLAGGYNHDVSLGQGSFKPHYGRPILLTITKQPGPIRSTTRLFVNGEIAQKANGEPLEGPDEIPDLQHRADVGVILGKASDWAGSVRGDLGEVLVYNRALTDAQRLEVESFLAEKYGLLLKPQRDALPQVRFTAEEKAFWAYQSVNDAAPPAVRREDWGRSPIDRFVLHQLEASGLNPAPPGRQADAIAESHVRPDWTSAHARRDR